MLGEVGHEMVVVVIRQVVDYADGSGKTGTFCVENVFEPINLDLSGEEKRIDRMKKEIVPAAIHWTAVANDYRFGWEKLCNVVEGLGARGLPRSHDDPAHELQVAD